MQDVIRLRGSIHHHLMDLQGKTVREWQDDNLVVLVGRAFILGQVISNVHVTSQNIGFIAVGSGVVAPTTGDTALGNEVKRLAVSSIDSTGLTNNPPSWQQQVVFATSDANTTIGELGLFNSSSGGTMIARQTIATFVKATSNTYAVSWTVSD